MLNWLIPSTHNPIKAWYPTNMYIYIYHRVSLNIATPKWSILLAFSIIFPKNIIQPTTMFIIFPSKTIQNLVFWYIFHHFPFKNHPKLGILGYIPSFSLQKPSKIWYFGIYSIIFPSKTIQNWVFWDIFHHFPFKNHPKLSILGYIPSFSLQKPSKIWYFGIYSIIFLSKPIQNWVSAGISMEISIRSALLRPAPPCSALLRPASHSPAWRAWRAPPAPPWAAGAAPRGSRPRSLGENPGGSMAFWRENWTDFEGNVGGILGGFRWISDFSEGTWWKWWEQNWEQNWCDCNSYGRSPSNPGISWDLATKNNRGLSGNNSIKNSTSNSIDWLNHRLPLFLPNFPQILLDFATKIGIQLDTPGCIYGEHWSMMEYIVIRHGYYQG